MQTLNKHERDDFQFNNMEEKTWIEYYKKLLYPENIEDPQIAFKATREVDGIEKQELRMTF